MLRRAGVALIVLFFAGCQSSRFAARGDRELEAGRPDSALANYQQALLYERITARERTDVEARARRAADLLVQRELEKTRALENPRARFDTLAAIVASNAWGSSSGLAAVYGEIDLVLPALWEEIEVAAREGRTAEAVRKAAPLIRPLRPEHPLRARLETIKREAAQKHVKTAENAPPAAAWLHAAIARRYGGALQKQITNPAIAVPARWKIDAGKDCVWLVDRLKKREAAAPEDAPLFSIALDRCEIQERSSTRIDRHQYVDLEPAVVMREEKYWEVAPEKCEDAPCARFDALGVCVEHQGERRCDPPSSVYKTRTVPVVEYRANTLTATHTVHVRMLSGQIIGKISYPGQELPINFQRAFEDSAFWTPAQQKTFNTPNRTQLEAEAENMVLATLAELSRRRAQDDGALLELEAGKAAAEQNYLRADEYYAQAILRRGQVSPAAATYFSTKYGLEPGEAQTLIAGHLPGEPSYLIPQPIQLPPADGEVYTELDELAPVVDQGDARGLALLLEGAFELSFQARRAPMSTADYSLVLGAGFRADGIEVFLDGTAPQLGSQTSGASFYFGGLAGDLDDEGWLLGSGLYYAYEKTAAGEAFQIFSFPVTFYFPVSETVSADVDIKLNFAQLKEWIDEDPEDPRFYSPVSIGLTWDIFRRIYLSGRVTHYLGIGSEVHGGVELGARL